METLEIEFKNLLTRAEFQALYNTYQLDTQPSWEQTNVYYDTPQHHLAEKKAALRLRLLPHHAEVTLKTPANHGLLETTFPLSKEEGEHWVQAKRLPSAPNIIEKLESLGIDYLTLQPFAQLTTRRVEYSLTEGALLVLDESWYTHGHDYELELEVEDFEKGRVLFDSLLVKHAIPKRPTPNKIQRATSKLL